MGNFSGTSLIAIHDFIINFKRYGGGRLVNYLDSVIQLSFVTC